MNKKFWSVRMFDSVPDSTCDHVATFEPFCTEEAVYEWRDQTMRLFGEQFSILIDPA